MLPIKFPPLQSSPPSEAAPLIIVLKTQAQGSGTGKGESEPFYLWFPADCLIF